MSFHYSIAPTVGTNYRFFVSTAEVCIYLDAPLQPASVDHHAQLLRHQLVLRFAQHHAAHVHEGGLQLRYIRGWSIHYELVNVRK